MAIDRQQAVVTALIAALSSDPPLTALIGRRIYDAPPARAVMPSLTVRAVSGLDASSADTDAQLLMIDIDIWDRYELGSNLNGIRSILGHIRRILHMQSLAAAAVRVLSVRCTITHGPFRDPDDIALHAISSVAVLCGHETP